MALLRPAIILDSVLDIDADFLQENHIEGLIVDVDNTLTVHGSNEPAKGVIEWLDKMKRLGLRMRIVSNNTPSRVEPFAQILDLPYHANGLKPLTKGIREAAQALECPKERIAIVGDQLFTDTLGGNLFGIKTILVTPLSDKGIVLYKMKQRLEGVFIRHYRRRAAKLSTPKGGS